MLNYVYYSNNWCTFPFDFGSRAVAHLDWANTMTFPRVDKSEWNSPEQFDLNSARSNYWNNLIESQE